MLSYLKSNVEILVFSFLIFIVFPFIDLKSTLDPETLPRSFVLAVLLLFYLTYYWITKKEGSEFSFLQSPIFISFLLYAILAVLYLCKSLNPGDGLYDTLKPFLYLSILTVACILLQKQVNVLIAVKCITISVLLYSFFGALQLLDLWQTSQDLHINFRIDYNLHSTLGTKNIYSEVLFLSLPFCIYGAFVFNKLWKWLSCFTILLILASLVVLMNLYVWLAFIVCFILTALLLMFFKFSGDPLGKKKNLRLFFSGTGLLLILGVFAFSKLQVFNPVRLKARYALNYIQHPEKIDQHDPKKNDNNIHERLVLISNTLQLTKDHHFLGAGISNWKILSPKYGTVSITDHVRVDYPHNDYLLILSELGIAGLLAYCLFFLVSLGYALKKGFKTKKSEEKLLAVLLFFGILGFCIISFFGFTKEKIIPMILLLIMVAICISKYSELFPVKKDIKTNLKPLILSFLLLTSVLFIWVGLKRMKCEIHLQKALKAKTLQLWPTVIEEAEKAYSYFYPIDFSGTPIHWYKGSAYFYSGKIDSALANFKIAERYNPYHVQLLNDIGTCYEIKNAHKEAIRYYKIGFKINPYVVRKNLVASYFNSGAIEEAYNLASSDRFDKPVFLEEILKYKSLHVSELQNNPVLKVYLDERLKEKKFLMHIYEKARVSGLSFESALITELKMQE